RFVRANQWANAYVANEGIIDGPAGEALRYRSAIGARDVRIFADVHVKFGAHAITADRSISEQARDAEFFDADVLIGSGQRTGSPTEAGEIRAIRAGTSLPVLVGSGLDVDNAAQLLSVADGAIVGSSLKYGGTWWNPVDPSIARRLMKVVSSLRDRT
ncbi:MAG: BtpA family membrane complex biogenesis protein, partial [Acidimicrobiia bacterium]|nr:BtpA family membrane complex biogenesis protein [Acidimicrobiia bacterium]